MNLRILISISLLFNSLIGLTQSDKNHFKLELTNNSKYTTIFTIQGNYRVDTILTGQSKKITYRLDNNLISFYLDLNTLDLSPSSFKYKRIRILNTSGTKKISITKDNQLLYSLTKSEKTIENYNPLPKTKNFWKLDSIISINSNDIAGAEIIFLSLCDIDVNVDTIKKYYNFLTPRIKSTKYGKRITTYLTARSMLDIGKKVDNFKLSNTTGKLTSLNNINSDYILIDFWFSRCVPCINSFPELQKLYSKTDRSKFEIVGISVDPTEENELWKSTILKYNLLWHNLIDSKSEIAKNFAIVNYPTKILLDKDRRIVLVDTDNSFTTFYHEVEKLVNGK